MNTTPKAIILRALVAGCLAVAPVACSDAGTESTSTVLVSAAASLSDSFSDMESAFEAAHPDVEVILNLAGSSSLTTQILEGAPADVFASADMSSMDEVVRAGDVAGQPMIFARNLLQIAVPPGNPAGVVGLADFADEDLLIGLCAAEVPCGRYARQALALAGVSSKIDTNEPDVRALLTKIEAGELDAGITYVTDVDSAGGSVEGIDIPEDVNVVADYPIAVLAGASDPDAARAFVEFVLSDHGRAIVTEYGFSSP